MKIVQVCGVISLLLPVFALKAATPASTARRLPPITVCSPDVRTDGRVIFRLHAPNASEVIVSGQWDKMKKGMTRDTNGVWSVAVGPMDAGIYEYSFRVDGLTMIDPSNPFVKPMRAPRTSVLHIPGRPPRIYDFQPVPHGTVSLHTYASRALGRPRDLVVYTPPHYTRDVETRCPVLYLQHGMGDHQATWTAHGKAHWILDNLIAQGAALPMIIVMMDGHAVAPAGVESFAINTDAFARDLFEEVIPFVEANFRVKPGMENRALAGLSMGGLQALSIGLRHYTEFGWVGAFSAAPPDQGTMDALLPSVGDMNARLKLLWIACGRDDFLLQRNEEFIALLKERGLNHEWRLTDGDHSWPVWRGYLADFAPRLFR